MNSKTSRKVIMNSALFKYINPRENDIFSKMHNIDLQELFCYMEEYYLELRNHLGFSSDVTFGIEIECEDVLEEKKRSFSHRIKAYNWMYKRDRSLEEGSEVSSPILKDTIKTWKTIKNICDIVSDYATIKSNSSGHIHIGTQVIGSKKESWLNFIKLWSTYENIIFRFVYGEFLTPRHDITKYADTLMIEFIEDYMKLKNMPNLETKDVITQVTHKRRQAVNFYNIYDYEKIVKRNTIEFRCPNGTLDPVIWQNNIDLFVNMLLYSKSNNFNDDIISKRQKTNEYRLVNLNSYNEIYLEQALEFADLIYDNNYDKIYFLKQYLKSFEVGTNELEKAKRFTKTVRMKH